MGVEIKFKIYIYKLENKTKILIRHQEGTGEMTQLVRAFATQD